MHHQADYTQFPPFASKISQLLADEVQGHAAAVRRGTVLEQVDALPGAQGEVTAYFFTKIAFLWYNVIGCLVVATGS